MEDDQERQPESLLPYEDWIETALRQVVVQAINHVAVNGLPGDHHFYITFRTDHPGVVVPQRLRAQYPQEMTIVLQHQFWELKFDPQTNAISVGLSFGGVPSILVVPLDALISFADPQVRYGLRFRPVMPPAAAPAVSTPTLVTPLLTPGATPERQDPADPGDTAASGDAATPDEAGEKTEAPQVVSLDAFRRRTPPKT